MVTREPVIIQADAPQDRLLLRDDPRLFPDFALGRFKNCLAPLHPAAWQEPARPVGMPHQKNPVFIIKHRGARAQGEAPRLPVEGLQYNL